jgi:hypothetical protein
MSDADVESVDAFEQYVLSLTDDEAEWKLVLDQDTFWAAYLREHEPDKRPQG